MGVIKLPATTQLQKWIGATGSQNLWTNTNAINITGVNQRMTTADENASGSPTTNPIPIPTAGNVNKSFWQNTTLMVITPPAGTINNVKWYTSGTNTFTGSNPGGSILFSGSHTGSYIQAYGTAGSTGVDMALGVFPWNPGQMSNLFTATAGAPITITGSISNPNSGSFTEWLTYQSHILSTAGPGATSTATLTWQIGVNSPELYTMRPDTVLLS
jgi:hypothetical protein